MFTSHQDAVPKSCDRIIRHSSDFQAVLKLTLPHAQPSWLPWACGVLFELPKIVPHSDTTRSSCRDLFEIHLCSYVASGWIPSSAGDTWKAAVMQMYGEATTNDTHTDVVMQATVDHKYMQVPGT